MSWTESERGLYPSGLFYPSVLELIWTIMYCVCAYALWVVLIRTLNGSCDVYVQSR